MTPSMPDRRGARRDSLQQPSRPPFEVAQDDVIHAHPEEFGVDPAKRIGIDLIGVFEDQGRQVREPEAGGPDDRAQSAVGDRQVSVKAEDLGGRRNPGDGFLGRQPLDDMRSGAADALRGEPERVDHGHGVSDLPEVSGQTGQADRQVRDPAAREIVLLRNDVRIDQRDAHGAPRFRPSQTCLV